MNSAQEALGVSRDHFPENGRRTVAAESSACRRPSCGRSVPPQKIRRGYQKSYCSDSCRRKHWEDLHPRVKAPESEQARLDFDRVTPAPATGEPYESARVWLLGRLQVGPVSTLELRCPPWRASQNPAQRVLELRNRQHDIRTVRVGKRTWYWLHVDGLPVGCVPEGE